MVVTSPPEPSHGKATADPTTTIGGSATDEDPATREHREAAERVLLTPIPGDSPTDKALEAHARRFWWGVPGSGA